MATREDEDSAGPAVAAQDVSRPSIARVYDYLLGGTDNFDVDRGEAERMIRRAPSMPALVRENRLFLSRAVGWLARQGIRQFVDIGSGLPTARNTHQVAQDGDPACRVVYADNDPAVVARAQALLAGSGVAAVEADLRDPAAVLAAAARTGLFQRGQPVAVILALVLHFLDFGTADAVAAELRKSIVPGSYMVMSVSAGDEEASGTLNREYKAGTLYNHSPKQIAGFFGGLELIGPGLVDAREWDPACGAAAAPSNRDDGRILAGVGRKPVQPGG
ncbi:MAG TPA: SAM-dependent methyltransferase [Streptosporangiaceae bacterium]|nr:SAM-dependent methyltransferase [Streptosporangiaceae bacterium]